MRILQITAGAGGMYCGSCLRDNALAAETMARGHDVTLLPVYTPTRTDEDNVSRPEVFFGGISVYLEQKVPLLRHAPAILDWVWDRPAVIRMASGRAVALDPGSLGALTVSTLEGERGNQAKEIRKLVRHLETLPRFDVVSLPMSLLLGLAPALKRALGGVPICCTLQGDDLFLDGLGEPWRTRSLELIRAHASSVDAFVATSTYYADFMAGYLGIDRSRIHVVPLGIRVEGHHVPPARPASPVIGYFARIAPEKGLHVLAEAYRILRRERGLPAARLEAAGYLPPEHRGYLKDIERSLVAAGLGEEFQYHGAPDRAGKIAFLQRLSVFSVPSPYAEPKGLYLLEAMANGIPVVSPAHGAFPEILAQTGGGLLFAPQDRGHLADRLHELLQDPDRAAELGRRGAEGVRRHFTAGHMAAAQIGVYASLLGKGASAAEVGRAAAAR